MKRLIAAAAGMAGITALVFVLPLREQALPFVSPTETPIRVLFVGDLMLDRNVARSAAAGEELFSSTTQALFADADLRVANLEGTVTQNPSIAQRDNSVLRFTFAPALAKEVLQLLQLDAVSLANNHALDFGEAGYKETTENVEADGVAFFGHPKNSDHLSAILSAQGKQLCLIGFHSLYSADYASVVAEIARLRGDCWRVVVMAHWGEEYQTAANEAQKEAAHAFIDAGADLVVGAHPHVVEEREIYKGKAIFYSLGNFMFDQNFSWETMHGLAVRADFYKDSTTFVLTPLTIALQHSSVSEAEDRARTLERVGEVAEFTLP